MAGSIVNYQCPACTGPLQFSGESGKLQCEYCGNAYEVAYIEELYKEKESKAAEAKIQNNRGDNSWTEEEAAHMRAYSCPSCGAEVICDDTTAATACVYCGNPTIVPGQFAGDIKPDYVIPFKVSKEDAKKALKEHYKGKLFLSKEFKANNKIDEIKGVYAPFWMFDGDSTGSITFSAEKVYRNHRGDRVVEVTEHYRVERAGKIECERLPVDASNKMPDAHADAIEPYDYTEIAPFSTAYLPGYLADRYDVSQEESGVRAHERLKGSLRKELGETVTGYTHVSVSGENIDSDITKTKYGIMPVWLLATKWKEKNFLFAMNGQTGKMIGDLPVSPGLAAGWTAVAFAAAFGILALIMTVMDRSLVPAVFGGLAAAVVFFFAQHKKMKTAVKQTHASQYLKSDVKVTHSRDVFLNQTTRVVSSGRNGHGGGSGGVGGIAGDMLSDLAGDAINKFMENPGGKRQK